MTMTEQATIGWVPVHPERGPDWYALTLDEDECDQGSLADGYQWRRVRIRVDDGECAPAKKE